jgi:hypothetical protein
VRGEDEGVIIQPTNYIVWLSRIPPLELVNKESIQRCHDTLQNDTLYTGIWPNVIQCNNTQHKDRVQPHYSA